MPKVQGNNSNCTKNNTSLLETSGPIQLSQPLDMTVILQAGTTM